MTLWDDTFRARLLQQGLSTDEIAQAVEVAEDADRQREEMVVLLEKAVDALLIATDALAAEHVVGRAVLTAKLDAATKSLRTAVGEAISR